MLLGSSTSETATASLFHVSSNRGPSFNLGSKKCKNYWENSFFIKALLFIPIVGVIPSLIAEPFLSKKFRQLAKKIRESEICSESEFRQLPLEIRQSGNFSESKKIIQIGMSHKAISMVRDLLTVAGLVVLLALSVLGAMNASLFAVAAGAAAIVYGLHMQINHMLAIHAGNQCVKQIESRLESH